MAVTKLVTVSGATGLAHFPSWHSADGNGLRGIVSLHGHTGDFSSVKQGGAFAGHPEYWADKGYVVGAISTGDKWASAAAMTTISNLVAYMRSIGVVGKLGMTGWSMGGLHALRWTLENMAQVSVGWVVSPAQDLDWDEGNAPWTTEIDALYGGSHATYLTQGSPRSPMNNAAAFRGGPKFQIAHATDDSTIPYASSVALVNAVGDGTITIRQPDILGDHQGGLLNVPPRESWEWLRTNWRS